MGTGTTGTNPIHLIHQRPQPNASVSPAQEQQELGHAQYQHQHQHSESSLSLSISPAEEQRDEVTEARQHTTTTTTQSARRGLVSASSPSLLGIRPTTPTLVPGSGSPSLRATGARDVFASTNTPNYNTASRAIPTVDQQRPIRSERVGTMSNPTVMLVFLSGPATVYRWPRLSLIKPSAAAPAHHHHHHHRLPSSTIQPGRSCPCTRTFVTHLPTSAFLYPPTLPCPIFCPSCNSSSTNTSPFPLSVINTCHIFSLSPFSAKPHVAF